MESQEYLERECRVFTGYLLGCVPHPYAFRKYAEAHRLSTTFSLGSRFDFFLIRAARTHRTVARLADSYARLFFPSALLRKKLVLLLAILETCPPSCHLIESVEGGVKMKLLLRLFSRGLTSVFSLTAGTLLFLPAQILLTRVALPQKSRAVTDRPYSLGSRTAGAVYDRPKSLFEAKLTGVQRKVE